MYWISGAFRAVRWAPPPRSSEVAPLSTAFPPVPTALPGDGELLLGRKVGVDGQVGDTAHELPRRGNGRFLLSRRLRGRGRGRFRTRALQDSRPGGREIGGAGEIGPVHAHTG